MYISLISFNPMSDGCDHRGLNHHHYSLVFRVLIILFYVHKNPSLASVGAILN